jgi:ferredoxin
MEIFSAGKVNFHSAVQKMIRENEVYGVKRKKPRFAFDKLYDADELQLDYDISLLPPNQYLVPPRETLIKFSLVPEVSIEEKADHETKIILGIHPYDLHAIKLSDTVFTGNLVDSNYQARRNAATIIGVDCLNPWPYSFAASMGTALPPKIFDLWLTDLGDEYLIEVGSGKGRTLLKQYIETDPANEKQIEKREKLRRDSLGRYRLSLDISPREIPVILEKGWNSPMWEDLGKRCFSCGSCTMVCPTCVCFDIRDKMELSMKGGERFRKWDSCMFDAFARVASGVNFRPTGTDRLRHRLHRKGKYMLERWGELGCVGCGRCVHACLVDIASPVYAYNRLAREVES